MIKFFMTDMANAYTAYRTEYMRGLAVGSFDKYDIHGTSLVGMCRKNNQLPKSNLPYVYEPGSDMNTTGKTIVLCDGTGIRDLEADLRYIGAVSTAMWEDVAISERFLNIRKFSTRCYVAWVGRSIKNRYNIQFEDQTKLNILLGIYYYSLCGTPKEFFGAGEFNGIRQLSEALDIQANRINDIIVEFHLDKLDETFKLDDLIPMIQSISDDLRNKVSKVTLLATVNRSWWGEGGVFYCNLAVEYPPMFMTLLYFALASTDYHRVPLGNVVKEFAIGRNVDLGTRFVKQFHAYIQGVGVKEID